jgi:hypothetical protein
MVLFGFLITRYGRRVGIIGTIFFGFWLVSARMGIEKNLKVWGITLATASCRSTPSKMLWIMIIIEE